MRVMQSRIRPPRPGPRLVSRLRLVDLIAELGRSYGIVQVTGTAGSGKTTAVLEAVTSDPRPLAWLTLDAADAAPGRLLGYLEAALARVLPGLDDVTADALASGSDQTEVAGLLAEAARTEPVIVVLDELERIAESAPARAVLSTFVRYAPPSLLAILVSRRPVALDLGSARQIGDTGAVTELDLAFTVDEAARALELSGRPASEAEAAVHATRGWVAGVLFEAWRSERHVHGVGGEADPLSGYLSSEIMSPLSEDERAFLIATSLLEEVTPTRADALGQPRAGEIMTALSSHRLPVTFGQGLSLRCHPRFREYLQDQLGRRNPDEVRRLHGAYGELLIAEGRHEDAVEQMLTAAALDRAATTAELVILSVTRRLDFAVAERWLRMLGAQRVECSVELTSAELLIALEREEFAHGAACADRLIELIAPASTPIDPDLACVIAWCYNLVVRFDDAWAVLDRATPSAQVDAMRFALGLDLIEHPTHYRDRPEDTGYSVDGLLARLDFAHGRFARLLEAPTAPWSAVRSSRVAALRALGRLDEALDLTQRGAALDDWTSVRVYVELMADLGRPEEALAALVRGQDLLRRSASAMSTTLALLLEAMLTLRYRHDTARARAVLAEADRYPVTRQHLRMAEQFHLWLGLAALLDEDNEAAVTELRTAVDLMTTWDRLLFLADAAVYLAEAEWRMGDESAADAAADLAYQTAQRHGSNHLLLRALRDFPAVASRRIDAEPGTDSAWHELGRILINEGLLLGVDISRRVLLREFGKATIVIDGAEVPTKLTKSLELLAYLVEQARSTTRQDLLDALFEGRLDDSARSYLRQALNNLRTVLGGDGQLIVDGDLVRLAGDGITTESVELEHAIRQASRRRGSERLMTYVDALAVLERGQYLAGTRSDWVLERRFQLTQLANDGRHAAAVTAFELGDYAQADALVRRVLTDDPYREGTWRLSMRIAGALGDEDRVIARYRACEKALAVLGTTPADSTRELLRHLRR